MDTVTSYVVDGMARALYVTAYADAVENHEIAGSGAGAGEDWMDVAPATPDYARDHALMLAGRLAEKNGMSLVCLLYQAGKADGIDTDAKPLEADAPYWYERRESRHVNYAEAFGHYLAMQSLGHGVSWFDNHGRFDLKTPYIESIELEDGQPSAYVKWADAFEAWEGDDFDTFCEENGITGEDAEILDRMLRDKGLLIDEA
jgi:hypothetical protein